MCYKQRISSGTCFPERFCSTRLRLGVVFRWFMVLLLSSPLFIVATEAGTYLSNSAQVGLNPMSVCVKLKYIILAKDSKSDGLLGV